jgi:hypothetical protein
MPVDPEDYNRTFHRDRVQVRTVGHTSVGQERVVVPGADEQLVFAGFQLLP